MATPKVRTCSYCKLEGHNIKKCPTVKIDEEAEKERMRQKELEIIAA